jgi:dephospho-CoA kinase
MVRSDYSMRKLIALTGSIGSGKSAAAERLATLGADVIDADILARTCLNPGSDGYQRVLERFGPSIASPGGAIDRKALGAIVFADPAALRDLEAIIHPLVHLQYCGERDRLLMLPTRAPVVYVVPLLFEAGLDLSEFAEIIVVKASRSVALKRIMQRDSCTLSEAEQRYDAQMDEDKKVARATIVLDNTGTLVELHDQIDAIWPKICSAE